MGSLGSGEPNDFWKKIALFFLLKKIENISDIRYILYVCKVKHERSMCPSGFVSPLVRARDLKVSGLKPQTPFFFLTFSFLLSKF